MDKGTVWIRYHQLAVDFHLMLAEMCFCIGDFDECEALVQELRSKTNSLAVDMKASIILFRCYHSQKMTEKAFKGAVESLKRLGLNFPSKVNELVLAPQIVQMRAALRGKSDAFLLDLPGLVDEKAFYKLQFLLLLGQLCWFTNRPEGLIYAALRSFKLSIKFGVSEHSSSLFAGIGVFFIGVLQDFRQGVRFGRLAMRLMQRANPRRIDPVTVTVCSYLLLHWREPLQDRFDALIKSYEVGMSVGNVQWSLCAASCYLGSYWNCGLSLEPLYNDTKKYIEQSKRGSAPGFACKYYCR